MNEQMRCKYGTGGVDKKNSEGYPDPTVYEALTKHKKGSFKPLVYICSAYAGDVEKNTERAKLYSRFAVIGKECYCLCNHTYFFLCIFQMNDPAERKLALFMDIVLFRKNAMSYGCWREYHEWYAAGD